MKNKDMHLNHNELIVSVVDENDLTSGNREHLFTCSICKGEKERLEKELKNFGRMAKKFAPLPRKKIILFPETSQNSWLRRPVYAAGFAVALLMIGLWWYQPVQIPQKNMTAELSLETEKDRQLMTEIFALEDNVLPDSCLFVSEEDYSYLDEEFMDFVIPVAKTQNNNGYFLYLKQKSSNKNQC